MNHIPWPLDPPVSLTSVASVLGKDVTTGIGCWPTLSGEYLRNCDTQGPEERFFTKKPEVANRVTLPL
jgi:hypothetical protein